MTQVLIITAPGSGQGKTLITAGIVQQLLSNGQRVALYKFGPDYLDPLFLEKTTGLKVRQLDYWLMGKGEIAAELVRASQEYDWVLIEGMMGLFDGDFPVSQLARDFAIPVLLVIDASGMAQSFGAVVHGMVSYDSTIKITAVIANKVGSPGHGKMLQPTIKHPVKYWGWLQRRRDLTVEHRHLGLESIKPEQAKSTIQNLLENLPSLNTNLIPEWSISTAICAEKKAIEKQDHGSAAPANNNRLQGMTIAVAHDEAFNFLYHANIDFLIREGASICYFSPLTDQQLPICDALYLPGGYPESHLDSLSHNLSMISAIRDFIESNKPCIAECGGMLYLQKELSWQNDSAPLAGVFKSKAIIEERLAAIGYQALPDTPLKGHTFHHAVLSDTTGSITAKYPDGRSGETLYHYQKTIASFVHWYFSSDPETTCRWFKGLGIYGNN